MAGLGKRSLKYCGCGIILFSNFTLRFGWVSIALRALRVQGGADEGEDLINAALRELREETGVTSAEFLAEVCLD